MQGFRFGRPMLAADITRRLTEQRARGVPHDLPTALAG
jgi:hypothetical protein